MDSASKVIIAILLLMLCIEFYEAFIKDRGRA